MKKFFCAAFCLALLFSFFGCANNEGREAAPEPDEDIYYTVNNETVTAEEIEYFKEKYTAEVMLKFTSEYGAVFDENFWSTPYEGVTPQEYLDSLVKEVAARAKIELVLCRENGIYEDISFRGLYNLALEYNKAHKDTVSVGLQTIPMATFYTYYIDNGVMELKNILGEGELAPTDQETEQMLVTVKEKYPKLSEDEQLAVARDILTENKYAEYINELYEAASIK